MTILVTGSAGHLGEAIVRTLKAANEPAIGIDILASSFTDAVGSITNRDFVRSCLSDVDAVIHTATLHKPHVATHNRQQFVDTNITGTLNLLEEANSQGIGSFIFTSTTSAFGDALAPAAGIPAAWINEKVRSIPKNIYGVTKTAAEDLCELFFRRHSLPCLVLRTSRFFPEEDDNNAMRQAFADENAKANEFLFRRIDLEDAVNAHLCALERAPDIGFDRFIISATTLFSKQDLVELRGNGPHVVKKICPDYQTEYERRGWRMFDDIDRVYVNNKARRELAWTPKFDFNFVVSQLQAGEPIGSDLARIVGSKGYHHQSFDGAPYPVD